MRRTTSLSALLMGTALAATACGGGEGDAAGGEEVIPNIVVDSGPIMGPTGTTGAPGIGTAGAPGTPGGTDPDTLGEGRDTAHTR